MPKFITIIVNDFQLKMKQLFCLIIVVSFYPLMGQDHLELVQAEKFTFPLDSNLTEFKNCEEYFNLAEQISDLHYSNVRRYEILADSLNKLIDIREQFDYIVEVECITHLSDSLNLPADCSTPWFIEPNPCIEYTIFITKHKPFRFMDNNKSRSLFYREDFMRNR